MKKLFGVVLAAAVMVSQAQAQEVCTPMPEWFLSTAKPNFDGTMTYKTPKLIVGGEWLSVAGDSPSAAGLCALLGKVLVTRNSVVSDIENSGCVYLASTGALQLVRPSGRCGDYGVIDLIVCK